MSALDTVVLVVLGLILFVCIGVIARQRHMIRAAGAIPLAIRRGTSRWLYGVGQYAGSELCWYRALGIGTRPSRVLRRGDVRVLSHRPAAGSELASLPSSSIVVECRDSTGAVTIALSDGAFTGFISWLEASAPRF